MKNLTPAFIAACCPLVAAEIVVDPAGGTLVPGLGVTVTGDNTWTTATSAWSKTEWNTNANYESWTRAGVNSQNVSGGLYTATSNSADPRLTLSNISGGPDLDLGWNDFIEFRLQLPVNYSGNIELYYGVASAGIASQTGTSSTRMVTIPNSVIAKDGAFHVYRVDMGLEPLWRGRLNDLRIDPATLSGITFALDYIRVGDVPGNDYSARLSNNCPAHGTVKDIDGRVHTVRSMESKRFRIIYSDLTLTEDPGVPWSDTKARGTLRNLEEVWQVYVKKHGYQEPCYPIGSTTGTTKYKTNMTMIFLGGTWAGGDDDGVPGGPAYGWQNTYPAATRVDPPSWVNAHEFMHVCQMHQDGGFRDNAPMGKWWEAHANYGQEIFLEHYKVLFPGESGLSASFPYSSFLFHSHGRHYYDNWPLFTYLDENPDNLAGLGNNLTRRLWRESLANEYIYSSIGRLAPSVSIKDVIGNYARRNATWDYARQSEMQGNAATWDQEWISRYQFAPAVKRVDDPTWWQVPPYFAPQAFAYTIHPLTPVGTGAGRVVSVDFRGTQDPTRQSDWRASLIVVNDSGVERYSPLWSNGTQAVTLASNENKVYLSVAATPGEVLGTAHWDPDQPYQSAAAKTRFPYEFQVSGAAPKDAGAGTTSLVTHANGGGLKSTTASVASTAYIGPNARVLDYAVVKGNARVEDNAIVSGHALLRDNAIARGNAKVREHAMMQTNTIAEGNARVGGHAWLMETARVTDNATIKGAAQVFGSGVVSGDAVLDGDSVTGADVSNGFQFGWAWGGQAPEVIASRTAPSMLFSSYEFSSAHPYAVKDKFGVTDAPLVGSPVWWSSDGIRNGFLAFNGSGQYAVLSRWQNDLPETTITASVSWNGGSDNQALFYFSDGTAAKRMYLTPKNNAGVCELKIINGASNYSIAASSALQIGRWTRVGVLLDGATASLYLDGALAASAACPVRPQDLLPADTTETPAHNYLARGIGLQDFNGSIDEFHIYNTATTSVLDPGSLSGDLLAWYKFDETSGTSANDSSTNNNDATLINGPTWNSGALSFDGIDDDVQTPVANGSARTLAAWIHPRSSANVANIESVFDCDVPGQYGTGWGLDNGFIRVILDDQFWDTGVPVTLNQWQHVALAFNATQARVYVNGTLRATLDYSQGAVTAANFRIGRSNANDEFFHGDIRDAKIYGRAVSDLEITEVINGTNPAPDLAPQSLNANAEAGGIVLTWQPANDGEGWYAVRRSTTSGGPYGPVSGAVTGTTFTDTNVTPGTTYHYVVIAVNSSGAGPESAEASATAIQPPADGIWANAAGGNWSDVGNWQDSIMANGSGRSATFNPTSNTTVTQDEPVRTIGSLLFANANHTLQGNPLVLDTSTGTPAINVEAGRSALIALSIDGSDGFAKTNAGTLVLSGTNTHGGVTTMEGGVLDVSGLNDYGTNGPLGNRAADGGQNVGLLFRGGTLQYTGSTAQSTNRAIRISSTGGATIDASGSNPAATISFTATSSPDFFENPGDRSLTLTGTNTGNNTFAMAIGQAGGTTTLIKNGAGTWVLSGNNSHTGATSINSGTLVIQGPLSSGSHVIATGAVLEISRASSIGYASSTTFSGTGTLRKTGAGEVVWGSSTANFSLSAGALIDVREGVFVGGSYANENWTNNQSDLNVETGAVFKTVEANVRLNRITGGGALGTGYSGAGYQNLTIGLGGGSSTFAGSITNTDNNPSFVGNVVKDGAGTIILTGASTYSGTTTINGGTLQLGTGTPGQDGTLSNTSGITNNAALVFNLAGSQSIGVSVSGNGTFTKNGPGTLNLQSFSGAPASNVVGGALHLTGGHNNYWAVQNTTVTAGASLSNHTHSHIKGLTLDGGELASTGADTTWGSWMLDQTVTVTGSGTSVISAQRVAIANASNVSRIFDVAGSATLDVTGTFEDAHTTTANGLTKTGTGAMILSAANTFTGPISVNEGTLRINGATAAASALTIASGATLGGAGTIGGTITVNSGGMLSPGNSVGTLTAGSAAIHGTLAIELDGTNADRLSVAGALDITHATLALTGTPTGSESIIATFGSLTGAAFSNVTGLPGGWQVTYDLANNQIKLTTQPPGFAGWIGHFGVSNSAADADPDFDGLPNALEYVLGGDPSQPGPDISPIITVSAENLVFSFQRVDESETADLDLVVEVGTDLSTWPETHLVSPGIPSSAVSIQENGSAPDTITVSIPRNGNAVRFARLRVIVTP